MRGRYKLFFKPCLLSLIFILFPHFSLQAADINYSELELLFDEPVTAIATGKPQRQSNAPIAIDIITTEEIQSSGAIDIPELLRFRAGIDVTKNYIGQSDVSIRGYNQPLSNRLLVLINGRQVYLDNLGFILWHALPVQLNEIKQIEIIRGPNSSLLGFNAALGVINIVTYTPIYDDIDSLEVSYGTQHYQKTSGITTLSHENIAMRLSAGAVQSDGYDRNGWPHEISDKDALDASNINLDLQYQPSQELNLRLEAGYVDQKADSLAASIGSGVFDFNNKHLLFSADFDTQVFGIMSAKAYHNESDFIISFEKFGSTVADTAPISNVLNVLQLSNLHTVGTQHSLRFGLEYRNNSLQGKAVGTTPGRFTMDIYSANNMWEWHINDQWVLTNALRVDHWTTHRDGETQLTDTIIAIDNESYHRSEIDYSYNTNLVYNYNVNSSYRFSVARGLHVPSLAELARAYIPNNRVENYGNPLLQTESNNTIELGYTRQLYPELKDSFYANKLSLNLFYQKLKNVIGQTVTPPGSGNAKADVTFENMGESSGLGLETIVSGQWGANLSWSANYTYMHIDDDTENNEKQTLFYASNLSQHKLNFLSTYKHQKWTMHGSLSVASGFTYQNKVINFKSPLISGKVDAFMTFNANITYQINKNWNVSLAGYNLIDNHVERPQYVVGSNAGGGNELEPNVRLTLRYTP